MAKTMTKNIKEDIKTKKIYRIIMNYKGKDGLIHGTGEPVPPDLTEKEIQDLIQKGYLCPVAANGENIELLHKDSTGRLKLSDDEILNLRPNLKSLNFLKRNKICGESLSKLKTTYDEMTTKYQIPNNYFLSEIYKIIDEQLIEAAFTKGGD